MAMASGQQAEARALHARDSFPKAEAILDGRSAQYLIRFDGLVDHAASRMEIHPRWKAPRDARPDRRQ
jgi:hypothetical protein